MVLSSPLHIDIFGREKNPADCHATVTQIWMSNYATATVKRHRMPFHYHTRHLSLGFIGLPTGHENAFENSLEFISGPFTRQRLGAWLLVDN